MTDQLQTGKADIVIIAPLKEEREAVIRKLPPAKAINAGTLIYDTLELPIKNLASSKTSLQIAITSPAGMGRVNTAIITQDALQRWKPQYIIVVGIAGGVAAQNVNLGDILICNQIVDYELQKTTSAGSAIRWEVFRPDAQLLTATTHFGDDWQNLISVERPEVGKPKIHTGPIASGDKVIAVADTLAKYRESWPKIIGVEMEAGGAAAAVYLSSSKIGFFMVRGVSDMADEAKSSENVQKWRGYACDIAASYLIGFLMEQAALLTDLPDTTVKEQDSQVSDSDLLSLADFLVRSRKTQQSSRRSLCIQMGIDPALLSILNLPMEHDFAVELVYYLYNAENYHSMLRMCDAIEPMLGKTLVTKLRQICSKLQRIQL
jgi:5'-methylthioadenosine/S-adenosylhomocysteine nucleosidase